MPSFLHSGDLGDCCYSLPTIRHLGGGTLYLTNRGEAREAITPARFEFIKPLLEAQDYISAVEMHKGQKISYNFTTFREGHVKSTTLAELQRRHVHPIGERPNFNVPWLKVEKPKAFISSTSESSSATPYIVVARSPRYHNPEWNGVWPTIFDMGSKLLFIGLKDEHEAFQKEFGQIEYKHLSNARQMAELIAGSELFIGNQSFPFSVAEGMKVKRVLEVCEKAQDCLYFDANVRHVLKATDWPECSSRVGLMLALQCHPADYYKALKLAELIVEIEPKRRLDIEAAVCVRSDVSDTDAVALAEVLRTKFVTRILRCRRDGRGWPDGCNDLWQSSMQQLGKMHREGHLKSEAVLTIEPDSYPTRKDWLDRMKREWIKAKRAGKVACGRTCGTGLEIHMNGNMVIAIDALKRFPQLQSSGGPWDTYHGKLFLDNGMDAKIIVQDYNHRDLMTADQIGAVRIENERPAFIHGLKHQDQAAEARINLLRHEP